MSLFEPTELQIAKLT